MKRKVVWAGIPYFIGLFFASLISRGNDFLSLLFVLAVSAFMLFVCHIEKRNILVGIVFFVLAFTWYRSYEKVFYDKAVSFDGQEIVFTGKIYDVDDSGEDRSQYILEGKINSEYRAKILYYGESKPFGKRDGITVTGTVKQIENKYTFKAKDYYKAKGIYLQFDKVNDAEIADTGGNTFLDLIENYRSDVVYKIKRILPGEEGDILLGILFGIKSGMDDSTKTVFFRSGIGHVMSVSGFHVVVLSAIIYLLLAKIKLSKLQMFAITEAFIVLFAICTDMSVSVIRAFIMITLTGSASVFCRKADVLNSLCISVFIITLPNPFAVRDASFLLSVAGVFGIGVFAPYMIEKMPADSFYGKIKRDIIAFSCVALVIMPVSILYFTETSIISPFANMLLIPFCSVALVCGLIVFVTGGIGFFAYPLLTVAGVCCKIVFKASEWLARLSFTHIALGEKYLAAGIVVFSAFNLFIYAVFRNRKLIAFSLVFSICGIITEGIVYNVMQKDILKIAVLGTEKYTVVVISKGNNADIIDITGRAACNDYVDTYLKSKGISNVNTLCIMDAQYSAVKGYGQILKYGYADKVIVPDNTYEFRPLNFDYGMIGESNFTDISIEYSEYEIAIKDGNRIEVRYGDFDFVCFSGEQTVNADVCVKYGKASDFCAEYSYLAVLDGESMDTVSGVYVGESNLIFSADKNGNVNEGRLYNG